MSCAFIDFMGFIVNDDDGYYIIKELAVVDCNNNYIHKVFGPPYKFTYLNENAQEINKGLTINGHGLIWYEGEYRYCAGCVEKLLLKSFSPKTLFYTVNDENKYKTLKFNFPHLRLVQYNGFDRLKSLFTTTTNYCPISHNPNFCALHNCIKMSRHYLTNFMWMEINKDYHRHREQRK